MLPESKKESKTLDRNKHTWTIKSKRQDEKEKVFTHRGDDKYESGKEAKGCV